MNFRKQNQRGKSELLVREVILPGGKEQEDRTSQSSKCYIDDAKEQTLRHPVEIVDHEVKLVRGLKHLEKKSLENYFGGTKEGKQCRRKVKTKKVVYTLNDFNCSSLESHINDARTPAVNSDSSTEEITEEMVKDRQLQLKIYKYQIMKECNDQKNRSRQKLAERNHLEELENLAETYEEYKKRRHQLQESGNFSRPRHPSRKRPSVYNRMGFSVISRKYWNDGEEPVSIPVKDKNEEVRKADEVTQQKSSYGELGEELLQKLVFVYDDDSDDPS